VKINNCYLCGSAHRVKRSGRVRDNATLEIFQCSDCGLVYLSDFSHIHKNHYAESGMHEGKIYDVNKWLNDTSADDERRFNYFRDVLIDKRVLDFGCGAGGFIEMAQKISTNVAGIEPDRALKESFKNRGLTVWNSLEQIDENEKSWDLITSFHVLEHLSDPIKALKELSLLLAPNGTILIEVPNSNDALLTLYGCESFQKFTYWSQHLFLFNTDTMCELVKKSGLTINWIRHVQRYPLSNHLYWLSNNKPGGHKQWEFFNNKVLNDEYEKCLAEKEMTDTILASIRLH